MLVSYILRKKSPFFTSEKSNPTVRKNTRYYKISTGKSFLLKQDWTLLCPAEARGVVLHNCSVSYVGTGSYAGCIVNLHWYRYRYRYRYITNSAHIGTVNAVFRIQI